MSNRVKPLKILLIINPCAGKKQAASKLADIIRIFKAQGYETTTYSTKQLHDATRIVQKCASHYDRIVCCGGDGTLNEVITGVMALPLPLPIGYIPTGTTNDMATSLGLSKNIIKAAQDIIHGSLLPQDIGWFNQEQYFSYIASFGAFTEVSYSTTQQLKNTLGYLAYVLEGVKALGNIHPHHLKIQHDGQVFEGDFVFGAVTNSKSVAGLFRLSGDELALNDGKFEVLLIRNPKNILDLHRVICGLMAQKYDSQFVSFFHASTITVQSKQTLPWTLDGEYAGLHSTVKITNLHNAINLIQP